MHDDLLGLPLTEWESLKLEQILNNTFGKTLSSSLRGEHFASSFELSYFPAFLIQQDQP